MNVIIVDDERLAREELKKLLKKFPEVEVIAECSNAEEGKVKIEELKPDLVFLDIEMPDKNGFEMLNEISAIPDVVIISAYDEYAIKAFEFQALDYLLKPIDANRLAECIKKYHIKEEKEIQSEIKRDKLEPDSKIFLKDGDSCWFVKLNDIILFESLGNYVKVRLPNANPVIFTSLNSLEERLPSKMFFRANRKYIINLNHVKSISTWVNYGFIAEMSNGMEIELSRRQSMKFKELYGL